MRTKYIILFFLVTIALVMQSFNDPYLNLKKRITDKQFKYEFFTTTKKVRAKANITYYWFKGGAIHNSQEGIAGELLDEQFDKFYLSNQLAEKGKFKKGKKIGVWRTWHPNGVLATESEWAGGQKNGKFISFNENGQKVEKGNYRVDKKQGKWINYINKDTLKYRDDIVIVKKPKKTKEQKELEKSAKDLEKKKQKEEEKVNSVKESKKSKEVNTKNKPSKDVKKQSSQPEKGNFFTRLFSKKDKTKKTNVKGT